MKVEQKLKIAFIILLIILISLISFGGIYLQDAKFVSNQIPKYNLGRDLTGSRNAGFKISTNKNTVIYDKDGKVVEKEGEGTTKKEEPVNPENMLTKENYLICKDIIEKRLKEMRVSDYSIRFDEETGKAIISIPENIDTDTVLQYAAIKGVFQAVDDEKNVLLTNEHIQKAQVAYSSTNNGTAVYLTIQLNKEGKEILNNMSKTYIKTVDAEGKETTKNITLKIDDTTILSTYFSSEITTGTLQLSIGQASTDNDEISQYIKEASQLAVLLNTGDMPLTYSIEENRYILSDITKEMFLVPSILVMALVGIGIIYLIIRYKKNGILVAISFIGYIAVFLLLLRLTNVVITLEGMVGILVGIILNYIFSIYLLHLLKKQKAQTSEELSHAFKETLIKAMFLLIPVAITTVMLCFNNWLPISSFGMTIFWGILISIIYNLIFTRTLITAQK